MRNRLIAPAALALGAALALSACGGGARAGAADPSAPLTVGASPVPHAQILRYIADDLAPKAGLKLKVVEFTDYVQPNVALDDGSIDANFFQTVPYLKQQEANAGYDFTALAPVHIEPLGLYSDKVHSVNALPDGAQVAIPNDPTNAGRALRLLAAQKLLTLEDTGDAAPTALDVKDNPKHLKIREVEAAQLPRSLQDVDAAVINGNYAIAAKLSPAKDAIALESAKDNPNANVLVIRANEKDDPRVAKLERLLHSDAVRRFIEKRYDGAVIPAF